MVVCSCCGEERDESQVAALQCHPEVKLCRVCIGWLSGQSGRPDSTPILPVHDMDAAVAFYESAGFDVHQYEDGGYAFVEYHDENVFDLDVCEKITPATNGAGCYLVVTDVDGLHEQLAATGLAVTPVEDMPWGMHEFTLTDPDGNHVRIGRSTDPN